MPMSNLIDRCIEARENLHLSYQQVADRSGVPVTTVRNAFNLNTRSPSIDTMGPICAVLGVSMDDFFGVPRPEPPKMEEPECNIEYFVMELSVSEEKRKTATAQRDLLREMVDNQNRGILTRNHTIASLIAVLIVLVVWALYLDLSSANIGFWRGAA